MKSKKKKEYIESVIVYFYRSGEYLAFKRKNSPAYFPKVKIERYSDDLDRDYVKNKVFTKIFSSNKVNYGTFKGNIQNRETIKVKSKVIRVIRIELDDALYSEIGSKLVPCKNNKLRVESECYNIIKVLDRKHDSPIYIGTILMGTFFTVLGIIALWKIDPNSRLVDVTSFIMLISTILINGVIYFIVKLKKHRLNPNVNLGVTFFSLVISLFLSVKFVGFFDNVNTSALSIIAIGITLIVSVIEYYKNKKNF